MCANFGEFLANYMSEMVEVVQMARRKMAINPKSGPRLKSLCVEKPITQVKLAETLNYEKQHISNIICGRKRLTPELAQQIREKVFPEVRISWLLGIDDFKTEADKDAYSEQIWKEGQRLIDQHNEMFKHFIKGVETTSRYGIDPFQIVERMSETCVCVTDTNGKKIGTIPAESIAKLQNDIEKYAAYLIDGLIKAEMAISISEGGIGSDGKHSQSNRR